MGCRNVADDTKLFRKKDIGDKQKLQGDIEKLVRWFEKMADVIHFLEI